MLEVVEKASEGGEEGGEGEEQQMAKAAALEGLAWMLLKRCDFLKRNLRCVGLSFRRGFGRRFFLLFRMMQGWVLNSVHAARVPLVGLALLT